MDFSHGHSANTRLLEDRRKALDQRGIEQREQARVLAVSIREPFDARLEDAGTAPRGLRNVTESLLNTANRPTHGERGLQNDVATVARVAKYAIENDFGCSFAKFQ